MAPAQRRDSASIVLSGLDSATVSRPRNQYGCPAGLAGEIDIAITSHNVPIVDGSDMIALGRVFEEINAGTVE